MRHFGAVALLLSQAAASTTIAPTAAPTAAPTLDLDATTAQIDAEAVWKNWLVPASVSHCDDLRDMYDEYQCCENQDLTAHYIFFKRPDGLCPLGWRSFDFGGETKCAKMSTTSAWTKAEAVASCTALGGTLVEPASGAKHAAVQSLIANLETPFKFFWIGMTQSSTATAHSDGWTWDSSGAALTAPGDFHWAAGQPTAYASSPADGPEDCALYWSGRNVSNAEMFDFHCDPASAVVCASPYMGSQCWVTGYAAMALESNADDACLRLLPTKAYSVASARTACGENNGWLVYTQSSAANARLNDWVHAQDSSVRTVFLNIVQDETETNPTEGWRLPNGDLYPPADMPWNSPSDPEPSESPFSRGADFLRMHVAATSFADLPPGGGGMWQDITAMTTGAGAICTRDTIVAT